MTEKSKNEKRGASAHKIAYYVQKLCKDRRDVGKTILTLKSQFYDNDLKEFAERYHERCTDDYVRHVANLLHSLSSKDINTYANNTIMRGHIIGAY